MTKIDALEALQSLPKILNLDGVVATDSIHSWSTDKERDDYHRRQNEAIAHSGLSVDEAYISLYRVCSDATEGWQREQRFFGRLQNKLTTANPGYAAIPGRILLQTLKFLDDPIPEYLEPGTTWLLRLDLAVDLRNRLKPLANNVE